MEALGAATAIMAVVTAAKDVAELIIRVKDALQQVKQNREDHADQIQQILDLLSAVSTACNGINSERPGLLDAVNNDLEHCLKRVHDTKIPSGIFRGYWRRESIKKTLEDVKVAVTDFLLRFSMGSNIRIERTASDNSDKLDKLLALERHGSSSTYPQSMNSRNQPPTVSSRKTKEFLIGRLQKLSRSLASTRGLSQPALASNTHRPRLSDATDGLLDAIAKTERILETYQIDSAADSAHSLDNLSVALMDVGLAAEASEISSFSVRIYGNIEASESDSNFAIALHNYSHHLSASRRIDEAVEQAQRAVDIYHRLPNGVFNPGRAKALDNLAACLCAVGKTEDALAASNQAVQISCDLRRRSPNDEHLTADLAMFLCNRANQLSTLRCAEDALKDASASQKCTRGSIRSTTSPTDTPQNMLNLCAYIPSRSLISAVITKLLPLHARRPKLARGLLSVVDVLTELNQTLEAKDEIRDAVKIFRRLARESPDIYNPEYARSLHRTGRIHKELKDHDKAINFLDEALSVHKQIRNRGQRDTDRDFAAAVCDDKHTCLIRMERLAEAAEASRCAVSHWEKAARSAPSQKRLAASRRELASTLYNLSVQARPFARSRCRSCVRSRAALPVSSD
ncbi:hypothetical protein FB451DRAFT_1206140 [Mycena latifolia]|nr:hypothetical protein FB451DRAFT_1206140 [Mycena latifolia]